TSDVERRRPVSDFLLVRRPLGTPGRSRRNQGARAVVTSAAPARLAACPHRPRGGRRSRCEGAVAMSELRGHPYLQPWVIGATHRPAGRRLPPAEYCPFCPTLPGGFPTEVPAEDSEIVVFQNTFPPLLPDPPPPAVEGSELCPVAPARGECEVVLYSPDHYGTLTQQPVSHLRNLIEVWADRYEELGSREEI